MAAIGQPNLPLLNGPFRGQWAPIGGPKSCYTEQEVGVMMFFGRTNRELLAPLASQGRANEMGDGHQDWEMNMGNPTRSKGKHVRAEKAHPNLCPVCREEGTVPED